MHCCRPPGPAWSRSATWTSPRQDRARREPVTVSFFDLLYHQPWATIRHFSYADPAPYGDDLAILVRLVAAGRLHPEIGRVADWAGTAGMLADLRDRRIRGNAVLTVN
jgi:NADPH2:quinone reductase